MKITAVESILLTVPYRTSGGLQSIAGRPSAGLNILADPARDRRRASPAGARPSATAFRPATKTAFDTLVAPMLIGRDPATSMR